MTTTGRRAARGLLAAALAAGSPLLVAGGARVRAQEEAPPVKPVYRVGDVVEDWDLPGLDGKTVKLSSFRGQVLLINFWASW
jgi:hypothetical protein